MEHRTLLKHRVEHMVNVDGDESDSSQESSSSNPQNNTQAKRMTKREEHADLKRKIAECMDESELQELRLKINSRERRRMHDLNSALDGLREVMPYANGPSVRKLSKIATLLLAKNYILMLNSSLEEMKKLVSDVYQTHPIRARAPPAHLQPPHVPQFSPSLPGVAAVPTVTGPSNVNHRDFETMHTAVSKDNATQMTSLVTPHDRHMFTSRWSVPCACNNCMIDSMRVSYPKYPPSLHASPSFHK